MSTLRTRRRKTRLQTLRRERPLRLEPLEDRTLLTTFGDVTNLSGVNTSDLEWQGDISSDGLTLYFRSDRPDDYGAGDLYQATRATTSDPFGNVMNLGSGINTEYMEASPSISSDGLTIYFHSDRPGGAGDRDLYQATRATTSDPFGNVISLGSGVNTSGVDGHPSISADGLSIFFQSDRPGGEGSNDLYHATRATLAEPFGSVTNLGPGINTPDNEGQVHIASDGLTLLFHSPRAGGYGGDDLYKATRADTASAFSDAVNLGPLVNSASGDWGASLSEDGKTLYFHSDRAGGAGAYDLYQAVEIPTVTTTYTAVGVPLALQDARGKNVGIQTSTVTVADSATILDVDVELDISHTRVDDLAVFLVSPSGTRVELFTNIGGNENNFTGTILDDEATTPIVAGWAPFTGTYQPEGSLADFDGQDMQGTWTLEVRDEKKSDTGTLNSWSLIVTQPNRSTLAVSDVTLPEGTGSGTTPFVFTVTRGGDTSQAASVDYGTVDDTATVADGDYIPATGTLSFAAGETSKSVTIDVYADSRIELHEAFQLTLANSTGATIVDSVGIATIEDDDATPSIDFPDFSDASGINLVKHASITTDDRLRLTPASGGQEGAAWFAEQQYVSLPFTSSFSFQLTGGPGEPNNSDGFTFNIQNFSPTARSGGGGTLGMLFPNSLAIEFDTHMNTEIGDPNGNHVSVQSNGTNTNSWEHSASLGWASPSFDLNDGLEHIVRVDYVPGTLSITLDDQALLDVPVYLDRLLELQEGKAWVGFTAATGGGWQNHDINNWTFTPLADTSTLLQAADASVIESDDGTQLMVFTVTRTGDTSGSSIVSYTTVDTGNAVAGVDYTAVNGTISFPDTGATPNSFDILVPVTGDTTIEPHESFTLRLFDAQGAAVPEPDIIGSILNDETEVSIADATAIEGSGALKKLDQFVTESSGGVARPRVSTFGPDTNGDGMSDLYLVSADSDQILTYDGQTGAFLNVFIGDDFSTPVDESGGLDDPFDIQFNTVDRLAYVSSLATGQVLRYEVVNSPDGLIGNFLDAPLSGAVLPTGISFDDQGNLYVADRDADTILKRDRITGAIDVFVGDDPLTKDVDESGGLDRPRRAIFGPDGAMYVASAGTLEVLRYDGLTGDYLNTAATLPVSSGPGWIDFDSEGSLYATGRTTTTCCDTSILKLGSDGSVTQRLDMQTDGWSLTVGPDDLLYVSGNASGDHVHRYGPSSLAAFSVELAEPVATQVTVDYGTSSGTATSGSDFENASGTVVFPPGVVKQTIIVNTVDDTDSESEESFSVQLSNATQADLADDWAVATITDDDQAGPNAIYVWDISFDSKSRGPHTDYRVVVDVRQDDNGIAEASDPGLGGVAVTVFFAGHEYTGFTDSNGIFRSDWIKGLNSGDYTAEVTDLALMGYLWDPFDLLDATSNDNDADGDGQPDDVLSI